MLIPLVGTVVYFLIKCVVPRATRVTSRSLTYRVGPFRTVEFKPAEIVNWSGNQNKHGGREVVIGTDTGTLYGIPTRHSAELMRAIDHLKMFSGR